MTEFKAGDKVQCISRSVAPSLIEGHWYEVLDYQPEYQDVGFTWPAYVQVRTSETRTAWFHAYRFKHGHNTETIQEQSS